MNANIIRLTIGVLLSFTLTFVSCVDNEREDYTPLLGVITEVDVTPMEIQVGDEVTITVTIHNQDSLDLRLWFADAQQTDYQILDSTSMIARSSYAYTQSPTQLILVPGQSASRQYDFNLDPNLADEPVWWVSGVDTLPAGVYRITGGMHRYQDTYPWDTLSFYIIE